MELWDRIKGYVITRRKRWLIEDIAYFIDAKKYSTQSPLQGNVKQVTSFMQNSMFMGLIATMGIALSIRRQSYGAFRQFSFARSAIEGGFFLCITTLLLYLNALKS